jgi:hypothetical protein
MPDSPSSLSYLYEEAKYRPRFIFEVTIYSSLWPFDSQKHID